MAGGWAITMPAFGSVACDVATPQAAKSLPDSGQILQRVPVFQPVLLGREQRLRRVPVLVEVLHEPALAPGEIDERNLLIRLRVDVPVPLHVRVAHQRNAALDRVPGPRVV